MDWEAKLDEILAGIDKEASGFSSDAADGWWDTSVGVEFGTQKLAEVKALIRELMEKKSC